MDASSPSVLLPLAMRQVLAGGPAQFQAVVLFADLAGYSRFCAGLVERDARGAEEVGRLINQLTRDFAEAVRRHDGSVLAFAGDATIAIWPFGVEARACAHACAADLHDAAAKVTGTKPLPLRILLGRGQLSVFDLDLGLAGRRLVAQGAVLDAIGPSAAKVDPGRTIETQAFKTAPDDDPGVLTGLNGAAALLAGSHASAYVAPSIARLLSGGSRDWLAEFRRASILFATVPPLPQERLAVVVQALAAPVTAAGGEVLQVISDDKGLVVLAVWGLATNTHADDAARAVAASLAMLPAVGEAGGGVGVATGKVWTGLIGGAAELQYAVIGDPVNLAAALSRAAPGALRVDAATAEAASARFRFSSATALRTKGDRVAKPTYCDPVENTRAADTSASLVGRSAELSQALALLAEPGAIVSLRGEAGIGKSRLAARLREEIASRGQAMRSTAADSLRRASPFHAWPTVFADLLTDTPLSALEDAPGLAGRLSLLNPVLPQPLPEDPALQQLDPATRGVMSRDAIAEAAAKLWPADPGVFVVEDAHWLDSASWLVLADLRRKRPDLALLLVTRGVDPAALPREAAAMLNLPGAQEIALGPLSRQEAGELAAAALGVAELPPPLVRRIHERAEGHPLFTAELARSLRDRGLVQTVAGRATVRLDERGIDAIIFPEGLEAVIAERISSLDPSEQLTAKAASVLGRRFSATALTAIRPQANDNRSTGAHLDAIAAKGLIEVEADGGYRFHHALIQETAYALLLREHRIALHGAAARLLEAEQTAGPDTAPVIAQHWAAAEDHDRAMASFERAAMHARTTGAQAEIVEFVTRALDHAGKVTSPPGKDRVGRWRFLSGNALRELGYYRRGVDELRHSIALLDRPMPVSSAGALMRCVAEFGRLKLPRRPIVSEQRDNALLVAGAMHRLSEISYEHDDIPQTLAGLLAGLNKAERAGGDSPELARLLMGSAFVGLSAPWAIDPQAYRDRSLAMAERLDDPGLWSWILFVAGNLEFGLGNFAVAQDYCRRCMPVCDASGEIKNWYSSIATLANVLRVEGRLNEAHVQDEALLARSLDRGMVLAEVWAITALAKGDILLNRFDELDACIDRMDAIFADPANVREGSTDNYMTLHLARAGAHAAAGRDDKALASLNETTRLLATLKNPAVYGMEPVTLITDMLALLARRGFAADKLMASQKIIIGYAKRLAAQYPAARGKLLLATGDMEALKGRPAKARQIWAKAQAQAQERRTPYDEAGAWQRLGDARADTILAQLGVPKPFLWT